MYNLNLFKVKIKKTLLNEDNKKQYHHSFFSKNNLEGVSDLLYHLSPQYFTKNQPFSDQLKHRNSYFSNITFGRLQQQFLSLMGKLKIWAPEEDEILVKVSHTIKSKKWKKASQQLRKCGFQRTDVECRQRYINHLDPSVNKELWSQEELEILYSKYDEYGNKWFLLQKHLPGRTQTKIKNYFYGTIRYFLKIIIKYFCKKSTGFVNDIKTQTLLDMYEAKGNFQGCSIIHKTIRKLKFKVQKSECQRLIRQNEEIFYNFTQMFLTCETQKNSQSHISQEEDLKQELSSHNVIRIQCLPLQPTKVEVISSTGGDLDHRNSQLQHLRSMAMNHFKWYEYYQNAYQALLQKKEENHL